ncbi:MAG: adenylate/guanylate cyclase domain-containing protein [Rhizobiales bacterium]|nr:adenylate/guanylate cyclase domain-containing protein [Hyphomicrobiales bacterium]
MPLSRVTRIKLVSWLACVLFAGIIGPVWSLLVYPPGSSNPGDWHVGIATGVAIASTALPLEIFSRELPLMIWTRSRPTPWNWLARMALHLGVILVCLLGTQFVFDALVYRRGIFSTISIYETAQDATFSALVLLLVVFILEMRALLGGRVVTNSFLGGAVAPREEQRIFLLLDMIGSSGIAETLGDRRYHGFLDQTFRRVERTIAEEGGEIYTFIGDAMIASWPLAAPERNARALRGLFRVLNDLDAAAPGFENSYGHRARLRGVLHGGPVIIGEYGGARRQVTYLGEVLNVTSRLERFAKLSGHEILVTRQLLERTAVPEGLLPKPLRAGELADWRSSVEIVALERQESALAPPQSAVIVNKATGTTGDFQ